MSAGEGLATLTVALALLGIVVGILWILLPFAVFGLKPLARNILDELRTANDLLRQAANERREEADRLARMERVQRMAEAPVTVLPTTTAPPPPSLSDSELKKRLDAL